MYTIQKFNKGHINGEVEDKRVDKDSSDGIPEQLKCPICYDVPQAEIYQCKNGHTICGGCQASVRNCPQCRVPFQIDGGELIRVRALESLLDSMVVPCPYKNGGCKEFMSRKDVKPHVINCNFNGKCVQLCKQLGYNCDFWTNAMNSGRGADHFISQHNAKGSFALDMDQHNRSIAFHIENLITAANSVKADGVWTPVMLATDDDYFMILTLLNDVDKSISWICLKLSHEEDSLANQFEVEFAIGTPSENVPALKWKMSPVSVLNCKEILKFPAYRMPIRLLERHYLSKQNALKVQVSIVAVPTVRGYAPALRFNSMIHPLIGTNLNISQITPRNPRKKEEINTSSVVWPKLSS